LFAELSARLPAYNVNRRPPSDLVKPRGKNGVGLQPGSVAGEVDEDGLGNFFSELRSPDLPQCVTINQPQMSLDKCSEGILRLIAGEFAQEILIAFCHYQQYIPAEP